MNRIEDRSRVSKASKDRKNTRGRIDDDANIDDFAKLFCAWLSSVARDKQDSKTQRLKGLVITDKLSSENVTLPAL